MLNHKEERSCHCKSYYKNGIGIGVVHKDFSKLKNPLRIYAMGDIHGKKEAVEKAEVKLKEAKSEGARVLLTGDILNFATKDSISFYHGAESPQEETERVTKLLHKYADCIDGIVSGNHDERSNKYSGLDTLKTICQSSGIPYHSDALVLLYKIGSVAFTRAARAETGRNDGGPVIYKVFLTHSSRGGRKIGSRIAKVVDLQEVIDADIYLSGHSHDITSHRGCKLFISRLGVIRFKEQVYANCGSFQNYTGYAVTKNFPPAPCGCVIVTLNNTSFKADIKL